MCWPNNWLLISVSCWPPSVYASGIFLGAVELSWTKLGYVMMMALWGALAALLQRFAKGQDLHNKPLIAARDVVNATLAAFITFLFCEHFQIPPALAAIAFTFAGYGGARFMEYIYQRFVARIGKEIEGAGGSTPDKP